MDARSVIYDHLVKHPMRKDLSLLGISTEAVTALTVAGFTIIHDSENHGPTLERCAKLADDPWAVTPSEHATGERLCEGISTAIRAMGEKKNG